MVSNFVFIYLSPYDKQFVIQVTEQQSIIDPHFSGPQIQVLAHCQRPVSDPELQSNTLFVIPSYRDNDLFVIPELGSNEKIVIPELGRRRQ